MTKFYLQCLLIMILYCHDNFTHVFNHVVTIFVCVCVCFLLIKFWQFVKLYNQFYHDNWWANCVSFHIEVAPTICAIWSSCKKNLFFLSFNIHFHTTILSLFNVKWPKLNSNMCWENKYIQFSHMTIERCMCNWKGSNVKLSLEIIIKNLNMAIVDMTIQLQSKFLISKFLWNIATLYTTY
jgi:hypothetical protein